MNYPRCIIGSITSPGEYWVVSQLKEHVEEVKELQQLLSIEMEGLDTIPEPEILNIDSCVAVKIDRIGDIWYRGKIEGKMKEVYEVFLIDCGTYVQVTRKCMRLITDVRFTEVEPLAFKLCLYGLIPITAHTEPSGLVKKQVSEIWTDLAVDYVKKIFTQRLLVHVKEIFIFKRTVFGDLYFAQEPEKDVVSLRKLLCLKNFAVYSEEFYEDKVVTSESYDGFKKLVKSSESYENDYEDSLEFSMKQERVKQWQKANFQSTVNFSEVDEAKSVDNGILKNSLGDLDRENYDRCNFSLSSQPEINSDIESADQFTLSYDEKESNLGHLKQERENEKANVRNILPNLKVWSAFEKLRSAPCQSNSWSNMNRKSIKLEKEVCIIPAGHLLNDLEVKKKKVIEKHKKGSDTSSRSDDKVDDFEKSQSVFQEQPNPKYVGKVKKTLVNRRSTKIHNREDFNIILDEDLANQPCIRSGSNYEIFKIFNDSVVTPVDTFRNLNISEKIVLNLEKAGNFKYMSSIQRWAVPSIQRGHSLIIISPSKTGKTFSYILPILDWLQDPLNFEELPSGNGPLALILCAGFRTCDFIYQIFHLLLGNYSEKEKLESSMRVRIAHGSGLEKNIWVQLTNGCDVLISTPHCLVRLLKYRQITNLERLSFLVVDDANIITHEPFLSQVKTVFHHAKLSKVYQKIVCGEKWTPEISSLSHLFLKNHALLIGSQMEAAVYAKLKPELFLVTHDMKPNTVMDFVSSKTGKRILIACIDESEVVCLKEVMHSKGYAPLIAHGNVITQDLKLLRDSWKCTGNAPIIICTDDVIHELGIHNVEVLIHYSLPHFSKTNFGNRFSTLVENYSHFSSSQESDYKSLSVIILVDDQNHYQLPHIVEFFLRLGGKVPEKIIKACESIKRRIEGSKKDVPICHKLLEFGHCSNLKTCGNRHVFIKDIDYCKTSLVNLVKFEVLTVHDVCHLSVRLIEHIEEDNEKSIITDFTTEIAHELDQYYGDEENRRLCGEIKIGNVCALEIDESCEKKFFRVRILEYKKLKEKSQPTEVTVKLIDVGTMLRVKVQQLYELPEKLQKYSPQAVDIFLCNILPNDFDTDWSTSAISFAENVFIRKLKKNQFWIGKVVLSLKNSLHIYPLKLFHLLENLNTYAIDFCVNQKLLSNGIAVENKQHIQLLNSLCEEADIPTPKCESTKNNIEPASLEPQWAYFEKDLMRVNFSAAENTSLVFLRLAKFQDLLKKMDNDCAEEAREMKAMRKGKFKNGSDDRQYRVGMYCLAAFENNWGRGRIESVQANGYLVYFIDYGDIQNCEEVLPISDKLMMQLPAQAIECSLVGLKHESVCSEKVFDEIYGFSHDGLEDLYANIIQMELEPSRTGGRKYEINLLDISGLSLNKKLVDSGLVKAAEAMEHTLQNKKFEPSESEELEQSDIGSDNESVNIEELTPDEDELNEPCNKISIANDASYFLRMNPKVFEDENAKSFLQSAPPGFFCERSESEKNLSEKSKPMNLELKSLGTTEDNSETSEPLDSELHLHKNFEELAIRRKKAPTDVFCYTPRILWDQDCSRIQIKIMLNNAACIKMDCSSNHILFRCLLENKLYVINLKLFGAISPQLTRIQIKTFFVQISLIKLCPLLWTRLQSDKQKYWWINANVEGYFQPKNSFAEVLCKEAIREIESGQIKTPDRDDTIQFASSSTDSEEESSSEDECEL